MHDNIAPKLLNKLHIVRTCSLAFVTVREKNDRSNYFLECAKNSAVLVFKFVNCLLWNVAIGLLRTLA
jgi:hypothetical protein